MNKIKAVYLALVRLLKTYPALSAAVVNVGIVALGYLGLHLSPEQFVYYVGIVNVLFGIIVHSNVTPLIKVEEAGKVLAETPVGEKVIHDVEAVITKEAAK